METGISREGLKELEKIYDFISRKSTRNASTMVGRLLDVIDALEIVPNRNVVEPFHAEGAGRFFLDTSNRVRQNAKQRSG